MAKVLCQKCGKLLSNVSENKVEYFLANMWIDYFYEEKYNEVVAKSNKSERERIKEFPEDGDDIDTYWRIPVSEWGYEEDEGTKHFYEWIDAKKNIHDKGKIPTVKEGEVWWNGIGENVGIEINGKSSRFSRPVLILRKLSQEGFMGVPLTSQEKHGAWYVGIEFLGRKQYAAICQARVYSVNRLYDRMGTLPDSDLKAVRDGFIKLYG